MAIGGQKPAFIAAADMTGFKHVAAAQRRERANAGAQNVQAVRVIDELAMLAFNLAKEFYCSFKAALKSPSVNLGKDSADESHTNENLHCHWCHEIRHGRNRYTR
jgi:hypothetical protein